MTYEITFIFAVALSRRLKRSFKIFSKFSEISVNSLESADWQAQYCQDSISIDVQVAFTPNTSSMISSSLLSFSTFLLSLPMSKQMPESFIQCLSFVLNPLKRYITYHAAIFLLSYRKMNSARNKSSSLYDQSNSEMRRKIIGSTMLQGQPQPEREVLPKRVNNTTHVQIRQETVRESTDRNMKFKLEQLDDKLQQFLNDLRGVRQENRELIEFTKLLKQNLIYEDLFTLKTQLDQKLTGFSNHIRSTKLNNEQRYGQIYSECSDLWKRTQQVRESVFSLQMRVQRLEQKMGFNQNYRLAQL